MPELDNPPLYNPVPKGNTVQHTKCYGNETS